MMSTREWIRGVWARMLFLTSLILDIRDDKKILTDDLAECQRGQGRDGDPDLQWSLGSISLPGV